MLATPVEVAEMLLLPPRLAVKEETPRWVTVVMVRKEGQEEEEEMAGERNTLAGPGTGTGTRTGTGRVKDRTAPGRDIGRQTDNIKIKASIGTVTAVKTQTMRAAAVGLRPRPFRRRWPPRRASLDGSTGIEGDRRSKLTSFRWR